MLSISLIASVLLPGLARTWQYVTHTEKQRVDSGYMLEPQNTTLSTISIKTNRKCEQGVVLLEQHDTYKIVLYGL